MPGLRQPLFRWKSWRVSEVLSGLELATAVPSCWEFCAVSLCQKNVTDIPLIPRPATHPHLLLSLFQAGRILVSTSPCSSKARMLASRHLLPKPRAAVRKRSSKSLTVSQKLLCPLCLQAGQPLPNKTDCSG